MRKKVYWILYLTSILLLAIWGLNYGLSKLYGFGNPILYEDNAIYGYRPIANQNVTRKVGKNIKINNLRIRCDQDWDAISKNKILVLGNSVTYGGSYIDNSELFSTLITRNQKDFISGFAGVNAWGVLNIYGLIVTGQFQPADTYVTVLIENDFYRGLTRSSAYQWKRKPSSPIHEVVVHYLFDYIQRAVGGGQPSKEMYRKIVANAAYHLKKVDDELSKKGKRHLIFISPTAKQVYAGGKEDLIVKRELNGAGLKVVYLLNDIRKLKKKRNDLFYDHVHLEVAGHDLWARLITKYLF